MVKRYCTYLRVSSRKQQVEGTIENQRFVIRNWLLSHPDIQLKPEDWFEDDGISAFSKHRPKYKKMREAFAMGLYDGVIVTKMSRIARSLKELLEIRDYFTEKGFQLIFIGDNIDTTTSHGRFFFNIMGAFMEFEKDLILERTSVGRARAVADGKKMGRKPKPTNDGLIKQLYLYGEMGNQPMGLYRIAKKLQCSQSLVRRRLLQQGVVLRAMISRKPKI